VTVRGHAAPPDADRRGLARLRPGVQGGAAAAHGRRRRLPARRARRGVVDCLGTDHAPHTRAEKDRDALQAPFGLPNIEVAFPLLYTDLVLTGELTLGGCSS
jgi:hypothetical protein